MPSLESKLIELLEDEGYKVLTPEQATALNSLGFSQPEIKTRKKYKKRTEKPIKIAAPIPTTTNPSDVSNEKLDRMQKLDDGIVDAGVRMGKADARRKAVLNAIKRGNQRFGDIARASGIPKSNLNKIITKLLSLGEIEKAGHGIYKPINAKETETEEEEQIMYGAERP